MAGTGKEWRGWRCFAMIVIISLVGASVFVSASEDGRKEGPSSTNGESKMDLPKAVFNFLWQKGKLGYTRVWPVRQFFLTYFRLDLVVSLLGSWKNAGSKGKILEKDILKCSALAESSFSEISTFWDGSFGRFNWLIFSFVLFELARNLC